jgi:hypothetical protein
MTSVKLRQWCVQNNADKRMLCGNQDTGTRTHFMWSTDEKNWVAIPTKQ